MHLVTAIAPQPPRSTPFPYTTLFRSVDGDGGLARLAVADDQLALATADRGHRVDRLDAGLQRLVHGLATHDRSEEHTSELQSRRDLVCRLLLEKKNTTVSRSRWPAGL